MTKKTIKRNIEEFANKLFALIADDTQPGHERLISVFTKAKARYLNEGYTKSRTEDFDDTLENITNFPDSINCLLEVLNFVSGEGGWEINSANTLLFFELIYATGYKLQAEEEETELSLQQQGDIFELKKSLCEYIIANNNEHDASLKAAEIKRLELEKMRIIKPENLVNVLIWDTPELARESQIKNPEKTIFCLRCTPMGDGKTSLWHLTWFDLQGKPNYLPIANEFLSLLGSLKDNRLPNPNTDIFDQLKVCCVRQMGAHSNIYLFEKGLDAGAFSPKNPDKHSLCLSSVKSAKEQIHLKWQLTWYDLLGKPNHIAISDKLTSLLNLFKDYQVASSDTELQYKIKVECADLVEKLLSKVQVLINPENNLLKRLTSTYVLTTSASEAATLIWYDSLGVEQPIPLVAGSALKSWLEGNLDLSKESILRLKTYLMHMNIRQGVDRQKQMNVLGIVQQRHGLSLTPTCIGLTNFLPADSVHYKACSFVITKKLDVWQLYYIDSLQKPILAKLTDCPQAEIIINKWTGEPSLLTFAQLQELGKVLVNFKPSSAIKLSDFSELERLLSKRSGSPSAEVAVESKPEIAEISDKIMPLPGRKKLDLNNFSLIGGLLGKKLAAKNSEPNEVDEKSLNI